MSIWKNTEVRRTALWLLLATAVWAIVVQWLFPVLCLRGGTWAETFRDAALLGGANVIMPNLSPLAVREKYMLYDGKSISGDDAGESLDILRRHMQEIGYELQVGRGDYKEGTDK